MPEQSLTVEKLIWRGRGLARLNSGKVVLIDPGVYPGERVKFKVRQEKKDYIQATWTEILEPLPERRKHPCPSSTLCGGCLFGTLPNRIQLTFKQDLLLAECSRALPGFSDWINTKPLQVFPSPKAWRYRWRGQLHYQQGRPHFMSLGSRDLVFCPDCLLFARPLARKMQSTSQGLVDGRHILSASPSNEQAAFGFENERLDLPLPHFGIKLSVMPKVFFQANWLLNQTMVDYVCDLLSRFEGVADCYAGAGNFALPLSTRVQRVLALESDPDAVDCCRLSAEQAGLDNVMVQRADLAECSVGRVLSAFAPQGLVLDPPRTGGGKKGLLQLNRLQSLKRMVWVSCDLVNTCRDLQPFLAQGWQIQSLALFDMFPQTWHLEAVFVLDRS